MTGPGSDFWKFCAHCGETLGIKDWPPTVEMSRDAGETALHSFCDEECKAAWNGD